VERHKAAGRCKFECRLLTLVETGALQTNLLSGSNAILEHLAAQGASSNAPEVISFALKWRAAVDKADNWAVRLQA
jgi:hypothetical protein